jgi:hypothetical protein
MPRPKSTPHPERFVADVTKCDVLLGQRGGSTHWEGNIRLRRLSTERAERYDQADSRSAREQLITELQNIVAGYGGRFLQEVMLTDDTTGETSVHWEEVDPTTARRKIKAQLLDASKRANGTYQCAKPLPCHNPYYPMLPDNASIVKHEKEAMSKSSSSPEQQQQQQQQQQPNQQLHNNSNDSSHGTKVDSVQPQQKRSPSAAAAAGGENGPSQMSGRAAARTLAGGTPDTPPAVIRRGSVSTIRARGMAKLPRTTAPAVVLDRQQKQQQATPSSPQGVVHSPVVAKRRGSQGHHGGGHGSSHEKDDWIVEVTSNDVIIGEQGASLEWEGNLHLRNIVVKTVAANSMVGRPFPFSTTVLEIVAAVQQRGARFLHEYVSMDNDDVVVRWRLMAEPEVHDTMKNACEICLLHMTGHGPMINESMDRLRLFDKLPDKVLEPPVRSYQQTNDGPPTITTPLVEAAIAAQRAVPSQKDDSYYGPSRGNFSLQDSNSYGRSLPLSPHGSFGPQDSSYSPQGSFHARYQQGNAPQQHFYEPQGQALPYRPLRQQPDNDSNMVVQQQQQGHRITAAGDEQHYDQHSRPKRKAVDDAFAGSAQQQLQQQKSIWLDDNGDSQSRDHRPIFGGPISVDPHSNTFLMAAILEQALQQQQQQQQRRGSLSRSEHTGDGDRHRRERAPHHDAMSIVRGITTTANGNDKAAITTTDQHVRRFGPGDDQQRGMMAAQDETYKSVTAIDDSAAARGGRKSSRNNDDAAVAVAVPDFRVSESDPLPTARQEEIYQRTLRLLKEKERQHSTLEMALSQAAAPPLDAQGHSSTLPRKKKKKKDRTDRHKHRRHRQKDPPNAAGANNNNNSNSNMYMPEAALLAAVAANASAFPGSGPSSLGNSAHGFFPNANMGQFLGNHNLGMGNSLLEQQRVMDCLSAYSGGGSNNFAQLGSANNNFPQALDGGSSNYNNNSSSFAQAFAQQASSSSASSNSIAQLQASAGNGFAQLQQAKTSNNNLTQLRASLNFGQHQALSSRENSGVNSNKEFAQQQLALPNHHHDNNNTSLARQASVMELMMLGLPPFGQPIIQNTGTNVFFCNNFPSAGGPVTGMAAGAGQQLSGSGALNNMLQPHGDGRPQQHGASIRHLSVRESSSTAVRDDGSSRNDGSSRSAIRGSILANETEGSSSIRDSTGSDEKEESSWSSSSNA